MATRAGAATIVVAIVCAAAACGRGAEIPPAGLEAAAVVDAERIGATMRALGADEMEGRGTGAAGYDRAAAWLVARLEALGVEPAGDHGTYFQHVPLLESRLVEDGTSVVWLRDDGETAWSVGEDAVVAPDPLRVGAEVTAPLALAGYGVHAPERGYDDWADVDVDGAVVAVFRGAPSSFPAVERALHADRSRTRALAAERGAVGILWLRTPQQQAGRPWERELRAAARGAMYRVGPDGRPVDVREELVIEAMLSDAAARDLLASAGLDLDDVVAGLDAGTTASRSLPGRVAATTATTHRRLESPNVVGRIPGSDPTLAAEHVVISGHLDHLGVGEPEDGDAVYNGTYDNASGIAIMLETARVLVEAESRPARSVLLLAVTAEERGLLGSEHWVAEPTVPLAGVVADVNLDMVLMLYPLREIIAYGAEHSTLGDVVRAAAELEGVTLAPDPFPDETIFVRSDQYSFVRAGIPSLFLWSGVLDEASRDEGLARWRAWMRDTYHTPRDDNEQDIDLDAGAAMARLNVMIVWAVADATEPPAWREGDVVAEAFAGRRDAGP